MNLQMQLRRGVIALVLGLALGGVALGGADDAVGAQGVGAVIRAVQKDQAGCDSTLRIDLARSVHLTVPCDLSCAPLRSVLNSLHVSTTTRPSRCAVTHTA